MAFATARSLALRGADAHVINVQVDVSPGVPATPLGIHLASLQTDYADLSAADVAAVLGCAVLTGGGAIVNAGRPVVGDTVAGVVEHIRDALMQTNAPAG